MSQGPASDRSETGLTQSSAGAPLDAVSVVIPIFNSEGSLAELITAIGSAIEAAGADCEFILVDDGSTDRSWDAIVEAGRRDSRVRGLRLMRNYGQHNALLAGIRAARNPVTVTLDDDWQHPPEAIPELLIKLQEGYDVVYGTPRRPQHGFWRKTASKLGRIALRSAMGIDVAYDASAFRAFRTDMRKGFARFAGPYVVIDVLLSWSTRRFAVVHISHQPRRQGRSTYNLRRLAALALTMVTAFSVHPLRLASLVGFTFTLIGGGMLSYVFIRYVLVQGEGVPGFPFLASVIAIFSGVQLFTLGLMGEYLARMHTRLMEQPSYAVREEVGPGE